MLLLCREHLLQQLCTRGGQQQHHKCCLWCYIRWRQHFCLCRHIRGNWTLQSRLHWLYCISLIVAGQQIESILLETLNAGRVLLPTFGQQSSEYLEQLVKVNTNWRHRRCWRNRRSVSRTIRLGGRDKLIPAPLGLCYSDFALKQKPKLFRASQMWAPTATLAAHKQEKKTTTKKANSGSTEIR